jgi:hypothetical protein
MIGSDLETERPLPVSEGSDGQDASDYKKLKVALELHTLLLQTTE